MNENLDNKVIRKPRAINLIGFWLICSAIPFIMKSVEIGWDVILSPRATLEWTYISIAIICGIGLVFMQEWARKGTVFFFSIYFIWALVSVNYLSGPSFTQIVEWQNTHFIIPLSNQLKIEPLFSVPELKKIIVFLMIVYIIWPIIAVLYLTFPSIKACFDPENKKKKKKKK